MRSKRFTPTAKALVVHHATERAYLCSTDGIAPAGGPHAHGWLPKRCLEVLAERRPFILVRGDSALFARKRLFGFEPATLKGDWTEEQQAAWRLMVVAASQARSKLYRPRFNRCEGRDFYA